MSTHPLDKVRSKAVRQQVRRGMEERCACGCSDVNMRARTHFDKKLKVERTKSNLRRLSCSEREAKRPTLRSSHKAAIAAVAT